MDLRQLFETTKKNGGITLDRRGDVVEKSIGYVVSHQNHEIRIPASQFTYETFVEVLLEQATIVRSGGEYYASVVGFWHCDGVWFSDISQVIEDSEVALRLGKLRKQVAIFDLGSKSAITL